MGLLVGLMAISIRVSLNQIILKAMVATFGSMDVNLKAFGKTIKCMAKEHSFGQTVESTKANM